jgi:N-acetylglucosamine-6-phosphate deacetylase
LAEFDLAVINGKLVLPKRISKGAVMISQGRIRKIGLPEKAGMTIDAQGDWVFPGLVDVHYHGGFILARPDEAADEFKRQAEFLPGTGVTRFIPTFATSPLPDLIQAVRALAKAMQDNKPPGAKPEGIHLEGPFLNPLARGAHPPEHLLNFDSKNKKHLELFEAAEGRVKILTFAPEIPGGMELLQFALDKGIVPAIGHSAASLSQVREFADLGARHLIHLFNGMSGIHHRDPGVAAAGLLLDDVTAEFICDGVHLVPDIVRLILRCRNPDDLILVSDYVAIGDLSSPDPVRLPGGILGGSHLTMIRAIKNLIEFTGIDLPSAVRMASLNPARLIGKDNNFGSIEEGKASDLVIVDKEFQVRATIVEGEVKWSSGR